MSSTPLLDQKHRVKDFARKTTYTIYRDYTALFNDWTASVEAQWDVESGELRRYWLRVFNSANGERAHWWAAEVDGKGEFLEKVTEFTMGFAGHGATDLDQAGHYLATLTVAYQLAHELQRQLEAGELTAPDLAEADVAYDMRTGAKLL